MDPIFLYGTLCHLPLLARVLDRDLAALTVSDARLADHVVCRARGESFPLICAQPGAIAPGLCIEGLDAEARARLDYYEGGYGYGAARVSVTTDAGAQVATMYRPTGDRLQPDGPWRFEDWDDQWRDIVTLAADEVMLGFPDRPPEVNARRYRMILARAAAALRARDPAPTRLRKKTQPGDIVLHQRRQPYARFFAVEEYDFCHRRFDGTMSEEMNRAAFFTADAATVMPYDPVRDAVLLIEQFRAGPYARGDSECWSVEAIAGLVDPGETPEDTVRREAVEEAGVEVGQLHKVYGYYPSPGAKAEFIYSYVGEADLPEGAGGLGGLVAEGEDIRAHVVPFDTAMELVESGEIGNAPLILTLLWLARNRERLRKPG
ncbi:ADP-ribose pyrophosphatase [Rhodovulum sp. P5]|uniref:NUDIX domain-containing protein n=1 Tax=Rhodovulum sp. P5 TaxID=1564506 RepID=UPI0009C21C15|nr:NUDIX domain-containing protein [Rhodovulum sp. P5]ARE39163.1 ADP-ribose pyrophosphatase [Rhodovulum sp. P5]